MSVHRNRGRLLCNIRMPTRVVAKTGLKNTSSRTINGMSMGTGKGSFRRFRIDYVKIATRCIQGYAGSPVGATIAEGWDTYKAIVVSP